MNMIDDLFKNLFYLVSSQTLTEQVMFSFFLVLLIYIIIIYVLKEKNKNIVIIRKGVFQAITFSITGFFLLLSCLVSDMIQPVFSYQIAMGVAATVVYTVCISGLSISKIVGLEFENRENTETYKQLYVYSGTADKISACISQFINKLYYNEVLDLIKSANTLSDITNIWIALIHHYIIIRDIKDINVVDLNTLDAPILNNLITNIVDEKKLWYNKRQIREFVDDICNNKVVHLKTNIALIPMNEVLLYVEFESIIEKLDEEFLINTFYMIDLLRK